MAFNFGDRRWTADTYRPNGGVPHPNPWSAIIDVPKGRKNEIYNNMPPLGGFTSHAPARTFDSSTGKEVEIFFENGKKKIRRLKTPTSEKRQLSRDEALDNPDKMWLYLKQYNKRTDEKWEEELLIALDDGEGGAAPPSH